MRSDVHCAVLDVRRREKRARDGDARPAHPAREVGHAADQRLAIRFGRGLQVLSDEEREAYIAAYRADALAGRTGAAADQANNMNQESMRRVVLSPFNLLLVLLLTAVLTDVLFAAQSRADEVLHGPRTTLGPPWTKDHRVALAATVVASARSTPPLLAPRNRLSSCIGSMRQALRTS